MEANIQIIDVLDKLVTSGAFIELSFTFLDKNNLLAYSKHIEKSIAKYANKEKLNTIIAALGINRQLGFLPRPILEALAKRYPGIILKISYLPDVIFLSAYISKKEVTIEEQEKIIDIITEYTDSSKPFLIPLFLKNPYLAERMLPYGSYVTAAALYALGSVYTKKEFFKILKKLHKLSLVDVNAIKEGLKEGLPIEDALERSGISILTLFRDTLKRYKVPISAVTLSPTSLKILELNQDTFKPDKHFSITANIISAAFGRNKNERDRIFSSVSVFLTSPKNNVRKVAIESIILLYKRTGDEKPLSALIPYLKDTKKDIRDLVATGLGLIYRHTDKDMFVFNKIINQADIMNLELAPTVAQAIKNIFENSSNKKRVISFLEKNLKTDDVNKSAVHLIILGKLKEGESDKKLREFLLNYLNHKSVQLRCSAISALGNIYARTGDLELFELLKKNISSTNRDIVIFTANAIGKIFRGTERDLILLKKFYPDLKTTKIERREFAITVLQVLFKKSGREMLLLEKLSEYFEEAFLNMRKSLVQIISEVFYDSGKELDAVRYMLKFLSHKSKHTRGIASEIIGVLIREGHKEQESVKLFGEYLYSENKYARRAAIRVIGHIYKETANKDARKMLKPYLKDYDPGVRSTTAKVIYMIFKNTNNDDLIRETLAPLLEDKVWYVKSTVKKILSELSES